MPLMRTEVADLCGFPYDNHVTRHQRQAKKRAVTAEVVSSKLIQPGVQGVTKAELDARAVGEDPVGGSYS